MTSAPLRSPTSKYHHFRFQHINFGVGSRGHKHSVHIKQGVPIIINSHKHPIHPEEQPTGSLTLMCADHACPIETAEQWEFGGLSALYLLLCLLIFPPVVPAFSLPHVALVMCPWLFYGTSREAQLWREHLAKTQGSESGNSRSRRRSTHNLCRVAEAKEARGRAAGVESGR